jgi:hypothetical protein
LPGAGGGVVASLYVGGSVPVGKNNNSQLGFRIAGSAGYEIPLGFSSVTLTPQLMAGLNPWTIDPSAVTDGTHSMTTVMAGVRCTYYHRRFAFWGQTHAGWGGIKAYQGSNELLSENGFAAEFSFGSDFVVLRYLSAGLFISAIKTVVEEKGTTQYGSFAFDFELQIKGKLPIPLGG